MNPGRWNRIEALYCAALEQEADRRAAFLDEKCLGDPDLRREVESLLKADEKAGTFFSTLEARAGIREAAAGPAASLVGLRVGHYQILAPIGAGAMGEIYLAIDALLGRRVALKVLPRRFTRDAAFLERFVREARAASALNHPNIITVYEIGQTGDTHFIATEFIEGATLRQRLAAGPMEVAAAVDIAIQCAAALEAGHRAGILHRDIKPENIMVRPDGLVKVVDFGLARIGDPYDDSGPAATLPGMVIGTPRYMSPEQARGQKLDARTDIFSLGAVLYELSAGRPCFAGETTADVLASLVSPESKSVSASLERAPEPLKNVLRKALEQDRDRRYPTMQEFGRDLAELRSRLTPAGQTGSAAIREPSARTGPPASVARSRRAVLALALAAVAGLAFIVYRWTGGSPASNTPPPRVSPITSFPGSKDFATFSPDGSQIAFAWNGNDGSRMRDIYVKVIGAGEPLRLTKSPEDDSLPAWSPDGRYIAFLRDLAATGIPQEAVFLIPALGGSERRIVDAGTGVGWSPDGKTLALVRRTEGQDGGGIFLLTLGTGEQKQITSPKPHSDGLPAFSPDGKWIAFSRNFSSAWREIFVVPARGGAARQLTFDRSPTYGLTWTADSREIVFSSNRGGGDSLWRVAVTGGAPAPISVAQKTAFFPTISRQGDRLAYTESFLDVNIYRYESEGFGQGDAPGPFGEPRALIQSSREDTSPSLSPDGERVVFHSKRTGSDELWVSSRGGGNLVQLTSFGGPPTGTPRWSPDGRWIAFDSRPAGSADIFTISAEGGTPRQLTSEAANDILPAWSPDGKWIFFISNRTGSDQIWRMPSEGGAARQVTRGGAREALVSADGSILYYTRWGSGIWSVPLEGGAETVVPGLEHAVSTRAWGVVEQGIYFGSKQWEDDSRPAIRFFSFRTRKVTRLAPLESEPYWNAPTLALSADGRSLLYARLDHVVNDIMLIEGFR
ncbi:MAG: serine/threonine-protein kinase [Bryobacteraceae bacterium]|nr:serine/threonine-protein kinase [Bryobacteraceae bacterium]